MAGRVILIAAVCRAQTRQQDAPRGIVGGALQLRESEWMACTTCAVRIPPECATAYVLRVGLSAALALARYLARARVSPGSAA